MPRQEQVEPVWPARPPGVGSLPTCHHDQHAGVTDIRAHDALAYIGAGVCQLQVLYGDGQVLLRHREGDAVPEPVVHGGFHPILIVNHVGLV